MPKSVSRGSQAACYTLHPSSSIYLYDSCFYLYSFFICIYRFALTSHVNIFPGLLIQGNAQAKILDIGRIRHEKLVLVEANWRRAGS